MCIRDSSENEVLIDFVGENEGDLWNNHVDLGLWADLMIIAPASANTMAKMASGHADNMLLACYLSAKCAVYFSPAMDLDMYQHGTTKSNIEKLQSFGNILIPAEFGELASGLIGEGRMAEPDHIVEFLEKDLLNQAPLKNKTVLITAGPTYEAIDPVRFIGNHSSGKMGFSIAKEAAKRGAKVILIAGPVSINLDFPGVEVFSVMSAQEMLEAVQKHFTQADYLIASAAVADYRPKTSAKEKIKKSDENLSIELVPNPDILKWIGEHKLEHQTVVGFALETENEKVNAEGKKARKNCDFLVLNSLKEKGAGFKHDSNKVSILTKDNTWKEFELKTKDEVAKDIWNTIYE